MDNPFDAYIQQLWSTVLPTLPEGKRGFEVRVWLLTGVCAYSILISLAFGGVLFVRARQRRKMWIARYCRDGYLTLNKDFFIPFGGAVASLSMLAYTVLQYRLFTMERVVNEEFFSINAFRPFSWIPIPLHGYFVAASAAQAGMVVSRRSTLSSGTFRSRWLRAPGPKVANSLFYLFLVVIFLMLIIPDIIFTVSWRDVHTHLHTLEQQLKSAGAVWSASNPGASIPALLETNTLYQSLKSANGIMVTRQKAVVIALIVVPFFLCFATVVSCLLLDSLLRLQIRTRSARHNAQTNLVADLHTFASPTTSVFTSPVLGGGPVRFEVTLPPLSLSPSDNGEPRGDRDEDDDEKEKEKEKEKHSPELSASRTPHLVAFLPTLPCRALSPSISSSGASSHSLSPSGRTTTSWSPPRFARPAVVDGVRTAVHDFSSLAEMEKELGMGGGGLGAGTTTPRAPVRPVFPSRRASFVGDGEMGELKRAERELAVCAGVVGIMTLAAACENLWNVIRVVPTPYASLSWAEIETSYFLPPFLYTFLYSIAATLLLLNLYLSRTSCGATLSSSSSAAHHPFSDSPFPRSLLSPRGSLAGVSSVAFEATERRRSTLWGVGVFVGPAVASASRKMGRRGETVSVVGAVGGGGGGGGGGSTGGSVAPVCGAGAGPGGAGLGFKLPPLMAVYEGRVMEV